MSRTESIRTLAVGGARAGDEPDEWVRGSLDLGRARRAPSLLIADDDRTSRDRLSQLAEQWGYPVVLACNGAEALRIVAAPDAPKLAILDWMMPGFDGLRVCRYLREQRTEHYVYVLVLTGRDGREAALEALEAGADDYVTKPFDERELEVRLRAGRRILDFEERLRLAAMHDSLTGVWNRGAVRQHLDQQLSLSRRSGSALSVLAIDLDHFKRVNDGHGHAAGDDVLRAAARRMRTALRDYDGFGRVGGEEFLAVLAAAELPVALKVAERLRRALAVSPVETCAGPIAVSASIGVASGCGADVEAEALMARADEALYRAKQAGRDRTVGVEPHERAG